VVEGFFICILFVVAVFPGNQYTAAVLAGNNTFALAYFHLALWWNFSVATTAGIA
jgi:hypothetical protein